jgi:hypothetical protein
MTYLAPIYLKDDPWFGPAVLSDTQMNYRDAYDHAVLDGQLLHEPDSTVVDEVINIHEVMYRIATNNGKTTLHLTGGSENFHER